MSYQQTDTSLIGSSDLVGDVSPLRLVCTESTDLSLSAQHHWVLGEYCTVGTFGQLVPASDTYAEEHPELCGRVVIVGINNVVATFDQGVFRFPLEGGTPPGEVEMPKVLPPTQGSMDLSLVKHADEVPYVPNGANYVRLQWYGWYGSGKEVEGLDDHQPVTLRLWRVSPDAELVGFEEIYGTAPDYVYRYVAPVDTFWQEFASLMERARYYTARFGPPDETAAAADSGLYELVKEQLPPVELPSELLPTQESIDLRLHKSAQKYNAGEYGAEPLMVRVVRSLTIRSAEGSRALYITLGPGQDLYIRSYTPDYYTLTLGTHHTLEFTADAELVDTHTEPVEPEVELPETLPPTQAAAEVERCPECGHAWAFCTCEEQEPVEEDPRMPGLYGSVDLSLVKTAGGYPICPNCRGNPNLCSCTEEEKRIASDRLFGEAAERRRYDKDLWMIIPADLTLVEPKHSTIIVAPGDQVHGDALKKLMLDGKVKHGLTADEYDRIARGFYTTDPPKIWWYAESGGDTSFLADHLFDLYAAAGLPNTTPIEKLGSVDLSLVKSAQEGRLGLKVLIPDQHAATFEQWLAHHEYPLYEETASSEEGYRAYIIAPFTELSTLMIDALKLWVGVHDGFTGGFKHMSDPLPELPKELPPTNESADLSLTSYGRKYSIEECRQLIATRENVDPNKLYYDGLFPASPSGRVPASYQFTLLDPGHPRHGATWAWYVTDSEDLLPTNANIGSGEEDFSADTFQQGLPGDARQPAGVDEKEEEIRTRQRGRYYQKPTDVVRDIFPWSTGGDELEGTAGVDLSLVKSAGFYGTPSTKSLLRIRKKFGDWAAAYKRYVSESRRMHSAGDALFDVSFEAGVDRDEFGGFLELYCTRSGRLLLDQLVTPKLPKTLPPTQESIKTPLQLAGVV